MKFRLLIRDNVTGEEVMLDREWVPFQCTAREMEGFVYSWRDGNFSCDCNRHDMFLEAAGRWEHYREMACGETRYTIPYAILEDGRTIKIDDK